VATAKRKRASKADAAVRVRRVKASDMANVIALDAHITKLPKADYWNDVFRRYGRQRLNERFFLVAEDRAEPGDPHLLGFIIGELRAWEFGSEPCGWVFALSVDPDARLQGSGRALLDAISAEFKKAGVNKMRTMVERNTILQMLFFRSAGMMAGPYLQLEKDLD
jgi:ribosomal protein S18 acetylase RimI-like enzyme